MDLKTIVFSELKPPMDVTVVTPDAGLPELSSFLAEKLATRGTIGLDTETNWCGDFFFRKVRTIQVGDKAKQFVIDLLAFAGSEEQLNLSQGYYILNPIYKPIFDILTPVLCSNWWTAETTLMGSPASSVTCRPSMRTTSVSLSLGRTTSDSKPD